MLARGTAAEVFACQQHAGALISREIEHEFRIQRARAVVATGFADIQIAPLVEQIRPEAGALDRLEKLLGNDLVGIDVGAIQRRDQSGVLGERSH